MAQNKIAIEFSTAPCSIAVESKEGIFQIELETPSENQQIIQKNFDTLLSKHNISLSDIELVTYGLGPGSFTGIRFAASWVQGFIYTKKIPGVGISSLENIAFQAFAETGQRRLAVIRKAFSDQWYYAEFENKTNDRPKVIVSEQMIHEAQLDSIKTPLVDDGIQLKYYPLAKIHFDMIKHFNDINIDNYGWEHIRPNYLANDIFSKKDPKSC